LVGENTLLAVVFGGFMFLTLDWLLYLLWVNLGSTFWWYRFSVLSYLESKVLWNCCKCAASWLFRNNLGPFRKLPLLCDLNMEDGIFSWRDRLTSTRSWPSLLWVCSSRNS
jgi:hypothetical protein